MYVRYALETDFEDLLEICEQIIPVVYPGDVADRNYLRSAFDRYLVELDPMLFCCVQDGRIVGFLAAQLCAYTHKPGVYTHQRAFCVRPESRGTRAAALLLSEFIAWSSQVGALQIHGGTSVGYRSKPLQRLLRLNGFETCGFIAKRDMTRGRRHSGQRSENRAAAGS